MPEVTDAARIPTSNATLIHRSPFAFFVSFCSSASALSVSSAANSLRRLLRGEDLRQIRQNRLPRRLRQLPLAKRMIGLHFMLAIEHHGQISLFRNIESVRPGRRIDAQHYLLDVALPSRLLQLF